MSQLFAFNVSTTTTAVTAQGMYDVEQQVWVGHTEVTAGCWIGNVAIALGRDRNGADEDCRSTCRNYAPGSSIVIYSRTSRCTTTPSGNTECRCECEYCN
ncbi:MAG: hypothetical protein GFH27_549291n218 [Chloroflexi bacterium AL-W]|nr:hypothetical protein [Chloroflexi bacterium AL-N1]NOK67314.1 hypothetical protein [Chloroflexi bacterium AL-N10]NOK75192.1 hypothetical protein [Chloroflexi bacterium AL-N5]NOK81980.1 hypothetical protein [Chloroflexi bacterium AL-W]NOK89825.1 hypothetical protein [Chloroflexi bacterium AL-N15]